MEVGQEFDGLEDGADPGMIFVVLKAVEGLTKGKITDDVKGGEVVPSHQIHFPSFRAVDLLMEFVDKRVDIRLDERFLLPQRLFGEGMCQQSAHARVIGVTRSADDVVHPFRWESIKDRVFLQTFVALTMAVDISPSLCSGER